MIFVSFGWLIRSFVVAFIIFIGFVTIFFHFRLSICCGLFTFDSHVVMFWFVSSLICIIYYVYCEIRLPDWSTWTHLFLLRQLLVLPWWCLIGSVLIGPFVFIMFAECLHKFWMKLSESEVVDCEDFLRTFWTQEITLVNIFFVWSRYTVLISQKYTAQVGIIASIALSILDIINFALVR